MSIRSAPDVVLACGCITTEYGHVCDIGGKNKEQYCPRDHGWQKILREAELSERVQYYIFGVSAPKRRSAKSHQRMLDMLAGYQGAPAGRPRSRQQSLF